MRDVIERQAAIDALGEEPKVWDERVDEYAMGQREQWRSDRLSIEALPSAEKKAKILNASPVGECSACGWLIDYRDGFNYCPGCGARLILIIARGAVQEWRE